MSAVLCFVAGCGKVRANGDTVHTEVVLGDVVEIEDALSTDVLAAGGGVGTGQPIEGGDPMLSVVAEQEALARKTIRDFSSFTAATVLDRFGTGQAQGAQLATIQYLALHQAEQLAALSDGPNALSFVLVDDLDDDRLAETTPVPGAPVKYSRKKLEELKLSPLDLFVYTAHEICHRIPVDPTRFPNPFIGDKDHFAPFLLVEDSGRYVCDLFGRSMRDWIVQRNLYDQVILDRFIRKVYVATIGRGPTEAEKESARARLGGGMPRVALARELLESDAGMLRALSQIHLAVFGRAVTHEVLRPVLAQMRALNRRPFQQEIHWLVNPDFWVNLAGQDPAKFVRLAFRSVLTRDPQSVKPYLAQVKTPVGRLQFAATLVKLAEHRAKQLMPWFTSTQGRVPTKQELDYYVARMGIGAWEAVYAELLGSEKYLLMP